MAKYFSFLFLLLSAWSLAAQSPARTGKDQAVLFYVASYQHGWERLPETKAEAEALAAELKNNYGFAVEMVPNPTKAQLEAKISEVNQRRLGQDDQLLLFFSMHGHFDPLAERGYLVPADGKLPSRDADAWKSWLSYDDLSAYLARNECGHILLALDACYSGAFGDRWKGSPSALPWDDNNLDCQQRVARALAPASRLYFSSGSREQRTPAKSKFANRWLEALSRGRETGLVRINDLRYFLSSIDFPPPEGGTFTRRHQPGGDFVFVHKNACGGAPPPDRTADRTAWRVAEQANTIAAYRKYRADFPNGEFTPLAQQRIAALEGEQREERDWEQAKRANTIQAYDDFMRQYPNSVYRDLAVYYRGRVAPPTPAIPSAFAFIKGGTFDMGCTAEQKDCSDDEKPVTRVTVSDFYLAKHELTVREFQQFINATGYKTDADKDGGSFFWTGATWEKKSGVNWKCDVAGKIRPSSEYEHPVIHVSWNDAIAYCNWRSEKEGLAKAYTISGDKVTANWNANGYRLPTEAEWEYAARGGGKAVLFGNGKNVADPREINFNASADYKKPYSVAGEYRQKTVPVGSLNSPNALGLHDMSGNVWEWCWDWYGAYPAEPQVDPRGPEGASNRVARGGSWGGGPQRCRAAARGNGDPTGRVNNVGFRLAL